MAREIGVEFNVQVVSVDKLTELTMRQVDGKPAPEFDTFIWGWGGDPYDPSFLLSLLTTERDRRLVGLLLLEPRVRPAVRASRPASSTPRQRKATDRADGRRSPSATCPYLVLTDDPNLQAYRTDRIANVEPVCPAGETGDLICEQVTYEPLLSLAPAEAARSDDDGGGGASCSP